MTMQLACADSKELKHCLLSRVDSFFKIYIGVGGIGRSEFAQKLSGLCLSFSSMYFTNKTVLKIFTVCNVSDGFTFGCLWLLGLDFSLVKRL